MTTQSWLMYLVLVIIATSTPGPAVLYIVTNSTLHGWRKGIYAAFGNILGLFTLGLLAVTGLGTILKTSEFLFSLVKYAGAAYLIYLGLKLIFQKNGDTENTYQSIATSVSHRKLFFQAYSIALSNPKAIAFLTALFPQFIDINRALVPQFSSLITVMMGFSFSFLMFYALLADKTKNWIVKSNRVKTLNRTSGSIFVGFGLLLATSSNK